MSEKGSSHSANSTCFELRVDSERAEEITVAAATTHRSVSAFVLDAAIDHAREVLSRGSATDLDTPQFDQVLDAPYEPSPALRRAATPATIVDLLGTDEGQDIEFEPQPLGLPGRTPDL